MSKLYKFIIFIVITVLLVFVSAVCWMHIEKNQVKSVPILMYHKIGRVNNNWWVFPDRFEAQMRFLQKAGYKSILPSDITANRKWGKPLPDKPVIITFDDGYLHLMTAVEPILKKYGFKGVGYLITGVVADDSALRKKFEGVDCLTWPEVRAMQARGTIVFGGHTRTHPNLAAMKDPYPEIKACYDDIMNHTGIHPDSFCYPYGQCCNSTVDAVKRAGFTSAMICEDLIAYSGPKMDLYKLPRVSVIGGKTSFSIKERLGRKF